MADLYSQIGALGMRLTELDREIEAKIAPLKLERERVQAEIDKVAAKLVGAKSTAQDGETEEDDDEAPLPPRRRKLLRVLFANPGADYGVLCSKMYGRDDAATRSTLSAEFSGLRGDGFVEAVDRGQYKLTELGRRTAAKISG